MIIENLNTGNVSNRQQIMAHAQTIMNFFTDAVEQNDCNVKIVIGFYTEMQDTINSINDLENAFNQPIYNPNYWKGLDVTEYPLDDGEFPIESPEQAAESPEVIAEAKKALKNRCFNCRFSLPQLKISFDRKFLFNKLTIQIEVYKATFKNKLTFSLCQSSFLFQRTCVPDLVRLVGLFLSAYMSILALRKLPKLSLGIFVKAVIGQLMAKVVASLKITLDMNSTGIPCIITALRDIAYATPTNENMKKRLTKEQYEGIKSNTKVWARDYEPVSQVAHDLQEGVKTGKITQEDADAILLDYRRRNDTISYYSDELQKNLDTVQQEIDKGIKMITDVVDDAVTDVNSYIDSILGVINFLQCENKRTGTDFSEVMEYAHKIQLVLNLISAIIAYIAKQFFRTDLCKDAKTTQQLKDAIQNAPVPDLTTPDAIAEIAKEWSGNLVKLDSDGLNLLIYEEPAKQMLPKLTLTGCNFQEFAAAHTLDNIISEAIKAVNEENVPERPTLNNPSSRPTWDDISNDPDSVEVENFNIPPSNPYPWTSTTSDYSTPSDLLKPFRDPDNNTIINTDIFPDRPGNTGSSNDNTPSNFVDDNNGLVKKPTTDSVNNNKDNTDFNDSTVNNPTTPGVILDTIPLVPGGNGVNPVARDWIDNIDQLIDLIYNPPITPTTNNSTEPVTNINDNVDPLTNEFSFFKEQIKEEQTKFQPNLNECRSIEDVMAVLEQIKI